jgi:hypothetical protein
MPVFLGLEDVSVSRSRSRNGSTLDTLNGPAVTTDLAMEDTYAAGAALAASANDLASEWSALIGLAADAVATREQRDELSRHAMTDPDQPVPLWVGVGGWARVASHARTNATISKLPAGSS